MSTQSNSHKPFLGVHFVLFGFGFNNQHQVKSKLLNGGGVDAGQYSEDCTHVIVHNLVYDDPLCVAARKDGKILATGLWVDHSFDIGMPVDHTSIMYRPSKDLNGIPGAKSFIICLTGYQRQDRDDVMTMVGLMGAQFSKPLVANKVTHLICYKFEGEKYELAKKIKRIKLVNHKWLEDCLNAWQILPEINYNRSGYELEMDIEAKDSEEEAEAVDNNPLQFKGRKMNSSPYSVQVGTSRTLGVQTPVGALSKVPMDRNVLTGPSNFDEHDDIPSVTGKYNSPGQLSSLKNVNEKHHEVPRRLKIENTMLAEQLVHRDMTNPSYAENDLNFTSTSVRKSHHPDMENSSGMIYSRNTPRKTTLQTENSNNGSDFSKMQPGKDEISGLYTSPSEAEQGMDKNGPGIFNSPLKGSDLLREDKFTGLSPQKRKMDSFYASSKSHKTDHDLTPCTSASLMAGNKSYCLESTHLTYNDLFEKNKGVSLYNDGIRVDDPTLLNSARQLPVDMLQPNSSSYGRKSLTNIPSVSPTVFSKIREESSSEKAQQNLFACKTATFDSTEAGGAGELQNQQQDFDTSSPNCRTTKLGNSHNHITLGGENDNLHTKSVEKMVAKKRLSSRGKLGLNRTANSVNKKGSIYLDKSASQNDIAACSVGGKGTVSHDNKSDTPSFLDNIETSMETYIIEDPKSRNDLKNNNESMDDETEAPDDPNIDLEETVIIRSEVSEVPQKSDTNLKETSEEAHLTTNANTANTTPLETDHEKAVDNNIELGESTCITDDMKTKAAKGRKRSLGKTKINTVRVVKKKPENEKKNETEALDPNIDLEGAVIIRSVVSEVPQKSNTFLKETSEEVHLTTKASSANRTPLETDHEKAVDNNIELGESTCITDDMKTKATKGSKRSLGKTKINTVRAIKKKPESEKKNEPEAHDPNIDIHEEVIIRSVVSEVPQKSDTILKETSEVVHFTTKASTANTTPLETDHETAVDDNNIQLGESTCITDDLKTKATKGRKRSLGKTKIKTVRAVKKKSEDEKKIGQLDSGTKKICEKSEMEVNKRGLSKLESTIEVEKENKPMSIGEKIMSAMKTKVVTKSNKEGKGDKPVTIREKESGAPKTKVVAKSKKTVLKANQKEKAGPAISDSLLVSGDQKKVKVEPMRFLLSGHRLQRKEFQKMIKQLKGKCCRDSHQWSYQATHIIVPEPLRRTEKLFAAAASGRWILNSDYLAASSQAGKFLAEESYEWHKNGLSEDGAINMEAPRKWRRLREKTGHGAFYGMRIIIYGECITPSLDTMKRAVKAGDGTILATAPPYTKFLNSEKIDFAVVSPGMPRVDMWLQEFLKHEIPCVLADYLVEYVCKLGYSLERHVLYNTHTWAEKSFSDLQTRSEEIAEDLIIDNDDHEDDLACEMCGSSDRGEVMLICGAENGSVGCGVGVHIDCCDPPLEEVPEEDWFCAKCSEAKNVSTSASKKPKKRSSKGR